MNNLEKEAIMWLEKSLKPLRQELNELDWKCQLSENTNRLTQHISAFANYKGDDFDGSRFSHACVLRRGLEFGIDPADVCLVGLRSWEDQEIDLIENGGLHVFTAADVAERGMKVVASEVRRVLAKCDAVHISFDIDALDPSAAPGTGIPDYGGLSMREVLILIKALQGLPLTGLDLVEVAPPLDPSEATVFAALKIIMEFIAVVARGKNHAG